ADPRHEEVLALLVALHAGEGRGAGVEEDLRAFVAEHQAAHVANPGRLRSFARSPLRVALHLLGRAAAPDIGLPVDVASEPFLLRRAVAADGRAPAAALAALTRDPEQGVREAVAGNAAAPAAALAALARDPA